MGDKRKHPNDVEAVRPIGEIVSREFTDTSIMYTFIADENTELEQLSDVYSHQTVTRLQEKIAELEAEVTNQYNVVQIKMDALQETDAKLKEAEKALEGNRVAFDSLQDDFMRRLTDDDRAEAIEVCISQKAIINQTLDTIRKEQG